MSAELLPETLPASPLELLGRWLEDAKRDSGMDNPDTMCLATADAKGRPSARMVLCRGQDLERGFLVFYTNRESRKGVELAARPRAAAAFHWDRLERQVRVEGPVTESPDEESDAYWATRAWEARIAAWASDQSRPMADREELLARVVHFAERYGRDTVPRPPHWGGYRIWLDRVELWVSVAGRVHDRALWSRALRRAEDGFEGGPWSVARLQP